jgi:hypothetical protein
MTKQEIIQKIKSVKLCLMAHPDNEQNSEFEDRISDLEEIESYLSKDNWIKIESEEDLPKEDGLFWHYDDDVKFMSVWHKPWNETQIKTGFEKGLLTHYQPIQKPQPPLY